MRIHDTEARDRRWEWLKEATGEQTTSGAIDEAAKYYITMSGDGPTGKGQLRELMELAVEQGNVTPAQIAETLDTESLPVEHSQSFDVGE